MIHTALLLAPLLLAQTTDPAPPKVLPDLRQAFADAADGERLPVYAVLDDRLRYADFAGEVEALPRGIRHKHVEQRLRAFADARQADVRALLGELEATGDVERVRQLWIANAVRFRGTRAAVERVAALPEVLYVGWDPPRDPAVVQDAFCGPPQPAPAGGGFTIYYENDFETGVLGPEATVTTTGCGTVDVTTAHGPQSGDYHAVLASTTLACASTARLQIQVDLTGATKPVLRFHLFDVYDETGPDDVLEVSNDGVSWTLVDDLGGGDGYYIYRQYPLTGLGLTFDSDVYVRWSWGGTSPPPAEGTGIDDVSIREGFLAQPNIEVVQAPELWNMGIDGSGVVLMNVDDGTSLTHPDLANRIWVNPNDPVDGVDNDGNGYVDDVNGWDFQSDDADPSGGSHGTRVAGVLVGDGTNAPAINGMAIGASLVIGKIDSEADHWEALQYAIGVAVDATSSSHSYKWFDVPKPDYHVHRVVSEMVLAARIIHANSIGNEGSSTGSAPVPFNVSTPGNCPSPWRHFEQTQIDGGVAAAVACGGVFTGDQPAYFSSIGPSAWDDIKLYSLIYPHPQDPAYWD